MKKMLNVLLEGLMYILASIILLFHFIILGVSIVFLYYGGIFEFVYFLLLSILIANEEPCSWLPSIIYGGFMNIFKYKKQN